MTSGVFFRRLAPASAAAHSFHFKIVFEQLVLAAGHRMRVHAEKFGHLAISPMAQLERLQSGAQATLFLIEQAEEQHDRRFHLLADALALQQAGAPPRLGLALSPGPHLALLPDRIDRTVKIASSHLLPSDPALSDQLQQRLLDTSVKQVLQFLREVAGLGTVDKCLGGRQQGAVAGKPNRVVCPQAVFIEARDLLEGIVAAAVRIAAPIAQWFEFAEHGDIHLGSQGFLAFGHGGDFAP